MAINPDLVVIKKVEDIPVVPLSELAEGNIFGYTGNGVLKKTPTSELLSFVKSGVTGTATGINSPTTWTSGDPDLYESYLVVEPIATMSNWYDYADATNKAKFPITQTNLDENFVYFNVQNGVVSVFSTPKLMPSGAPVLNPADVDEIPASKAVADYVKDNQSIVISALTLAELSPQIDYDADSIALVVNDANPKYNGYYKKIGAKGSGGWDFTDSVGFIKKNNLAIHKETVAELQTNLNFNAGEIAIVTNEPNPNNNGVYRKVSGVGSGGWEKTNFINPLHHKKVTPTTANDTESLAIGGGHTFIFQDEPGTGQGHTAFGFEAGLGIGNCWATTLVGWKAGRALSNKSVVNTWTGLIGNTGNSLFGYNTAPIADGMLDCSYFGTSAGQNSTTCMDNAGFGIWSLRLIEEGSENAGFGHLSLGYVIGKGSYENLDSLEINPANPTYSWGHRNVGVGDKAGALDTGGNALNYIKKNVYVGAQTRGTNYSYNENVFGYAGNGRGTNTTVIGNVDIKETTIFGTIRAVTLFTVDTLPTGISGERAFVTDATSTVFSANAVGGGTNRMPVYFDGNAWRIG